jgi:hypothetical protein
MSGSNSKGVELSFITFGGPLDSKDKKKLGREVRSHITRLQHRNIREQQHRTYSDWERSLIPKHVDKPHQELGTDEQRGDVETDTLVRPSSGSLDEPHTRQPTLTISGGSEGS